MVILYVLASTQRVNGAYSMENILIHINLLKIG